MARYGLIAGSGRFPFLVLDAARGLGHEIVVIGIKEEAAAEIEARAPNCHWISIGQLSRMIEILKRERIHEVMMAGQVKHVSIFSSIRPDWRLIKMLAALKEKNTGALIGSVAQVLKDEGIQLVDSTTLLKPLLAGLGVLTRRRPSEAEERDAHYGRRIARTLSELDVGQSVAIADRACVAIEAMEGTDAMLRRAAGLANGKPLTLVKCSWRRKHMLFDVPVAGCTTIATMREAGATLLAVDAGRTLLLDKADMISQADQAAISIVGYAPEQGEP